MNRIFLGNFDFEHALAGRLDVQSAAVARLKREMACLWAAVADDGDCIWLPAVVEDGFFKRLSDAGLPRVSAVADAAGIPGAVEARPWGWTEEIRGQCERRGWRQTAPPQDVVRSVNSRCFSLELERSWGIGLENAAIVRTADELRSAVKRIGTTDSRWVLKAEFGMSARERVLGRGKRVDGQTVNWLQRRLATGEYAVVEPWVDRVDEAGLQFTIPEDGPPVFDGVVPLLCDEAGSYRGSRLGDEDEQRGRWEGAIETGLRVAGVLRARGYFGPLGIDAMRYRDGAGEERLRPVQDVNARYTMGRLALGLRRVLQPGESATWLHVRWPTDSVDAPRRWFEEFQTKLPNAVRVIRTSPFLLDNHPVGHGTFLLISSDADGLHFAETSAFSA